MLFVVITLFSRQIVALKLTTTRQFERQSKPGSAHRLRQCMSKESILFFIFIFCSTWCSTRDEVKLVASRTTHSQGIMTARKELYAGGNVLIEVACQLTQRTRPRALLFTWSRACEILAHTQSQEIFISLSVISFTLPTRSPTRKVPAIMVHMNNMLHRESKRWFTQ